MNAKKIFSVTERESIMDPADSGLVNTRIALNGWLTEVAEIRSLYAPPYFSENFKMTVRVNDWRIKTRDYRWSPECLTRQGSRKGLKVTSELIPLKEERAAIMRMKVKNTTKQKEDVHFQYELYAGVNKKANWQFGHPIQNAYAVKTWEKDTLIVSNETGEIRLHSSLDVAPSMPVRTGVLNSAVYALEPQEEIVFYTTIVIGTPEDNKRVIKAAAADPEKCCAEACRWWEMRIKNLFKQLPDLESDNKELVTYYHRSLLHLLLNEWGGKDFFLNPHYGTGCISGDTICCYMWNYGGPYRMWSLLNPKSAKEHIRHLLSLELTNCYAFYADDGRGFGPYYPINQEKVIFLSYYYVMQTRDTALLSEDLNGKKIIEHLVDQALALDDLSKEASLADYGTSNAHLELRDPTFATDPMMRYDGLVPDLNLRRCSNMRLVNELCTLIGYKSSVDLVKRAEALKKLIHEKLYSEKHGWFRCIGAQGHEIYRYTNQMFKNLGWGDWVLEKEAENALVEKLMDETKFLGKFGVHSLSKDDPAYYEDDVDNGGPGACVSFTPAIIDRLYRSGRVNEAQTILKRLLWMGGCLPYWGDSQRGDVRDYRRITSLQCDIEGIVPSQTLIFGMFGIKILPDFSVEIDPHLFPETQHMKLKNVRLAGMVFNIECTAEKVTVTCGRKKIEAAPGEKILLPAVK